MPRIISRLSNDTSIYCYKTKNVIGTIKGGANVAQATMFNGTPVYTTKEYVDYEMSEDEYDRIKDHQSFKAQVAANYVEVISGPGRNKVNGSKVAKDATKEKDKSAPHTKGAAPQENLDGEDLSSAIK